MLKISLLLMKSLNKTETPISNPTCSLFPKAIFLTFIQHFMQIVSYGDNLHEMLKPIS